ncbi:MAG: hypothetical protein F4X64_17015 [Chloroflexi bacterium]|nr:hypothetical protein [Chloroflexota bacterium]
MAIDKCFLCGSDGTLQLGHVIPRFATNYIKRTSGKRGHKRLRRGYDGAVTQDGAKYRMFCRSCEQLLSKDEAMFSRQAFGKSYFSASKPVPYEEWMLRFAVGLMLRVCAAELHFADPSLVARPLKTRERREFDRACDDFRYYLRGDAIWPGKLAPLRLSFGLRSVPADRIIRNPVDQYMTRGVDYTLAIDGGILAVYAHIPSHVFWTQISPKTVKESDWPNSRIRKKGLIDMYRKQSAPDYFWEFLEERVSITMETFSDSLQKTIAWQEQG